MYFHLSIACCIPSLSYLTLTGTVTFLRLAPIKSKLASTVIIKHSHLLVVMVTLFCALLCWFVAVEVSM